MKFDQILNWWIYTLRFCRTQLSFHVFRYLKIGEEAEYKFHAKMFTDKLWAKYFIQSLGENISFDDIGTSSDFGFGLKSAHKLHSRKTG